MALGLIFFTDGWIVFLVCQFFFLVLVDYFFSWVKFLSLGLNVSCWPDFSSRGSKLFLVEEKFLLYYLYHFLPKVKILFKDATVILYSGGKVICLV